jgi:hypothetical protein
MLVGGFNHFQKYESQWEGLSHILWKIFFFETTSQHVFSYEIWGFPADTLRKLGTIANQIRANDLVKVLIG